MNTVHWLTKGVTGGPTSRCTRKFHSFNEEIIVGWKVHRLTLMQWLNLNKCGLFFNIVSPAVHTLLPLVLHMQRGIEALILILEEVLNCRYDLIIGLLLLPNQVFFYVGEQKIVRWCQIRRIWRAINQFKATVTHKSHYNHRFVCRSIVLVKQDSLSTDFQAVSEMCQVLLLKVLYVFLKGNNTVSIRKGWIQCQVSLLWHNSFLVSLWSFQPSLPRSYQLFNFMICNKVLVWQWE